MLKNITLVAALLVGSPAMAGDYSVGTKYLFPAGLIYCDKDAVENQVEMLAAGIEKRVTGCYKSTSQSDMKLLKNYPDLGFSKWVMLIDDFYYTTYLPNALIN